MVGYGIRWLVVVRSRQCCCPTTCFRNENRTTFDGSIVYKSLSKSILGKEFMATPQQLAHSSRVRNVVGAYRLCTYHSPALWPSPLAPSSMSLSATPAPLPPPSSDPLPPLLPLDGWITLVNRAYVVMQQDGNAVDH